jgi:LmbE family N-acetylglucosaminyl deacetylase
MTGAERRSRSLSPRVVLVVAAHPDDEILGCGGTMARHADQGDEVRILILAEGSTSRAAVRDPSDPTISLLRTAAAAAADIVGAKPPRFGGFPDQRLDSVDALDITKVIEDEIETAAPSVVYTHHGNDLNRDHRIVHDACLAAARPLLGSSVREVYTFETLSSTEWSSGAMGGGFVPQRFVEITEQMERKQEALAAYTTEMRDFPHPRSHAAVEALARVRGATVGVHAAEAFGVVRSVVVGNQRPVG